MNFCAFWALEFIWPAMLFADLGCIGCTCDCFWAVMFLSEGCPDVVALYGIK